MLLSLSRSCLVLLACCCCAALLASATADAPDSELDSIASFGVPLTFSLVNTVRYELNRLINNMWINHPGSTVCGSCLINGWASNTGSSIGRTFPVSQIDSALAGIPADLAKKVRAIAFSNKVVFESFRHSINAPASRGHYLQYLGIARRSGNNVDLALLKGEVVGRMVQKYTVRHVRVCGKALWWKCCCKDHYYSQPRGYQTGEILKIETAMKAETVRRLRERAQDIKF